jgi:hypothetical protein
VIHFLVSMTPPPPPPHLSVNISFKDWASWDRIVNHALAGENGVDTPAPASAGRCAHADSLREDYDDCGGGEEGGWISAPVPWWCASDEKLDYAGFRVMFYLGQSNPKKYRQEMFPVGECWLERPPACTHTHTHTHTRTRTHTMKRTPAPLKVCCSARARNWHLSSPREL